MKEKGFDSTVDKKTLEQYSKIDKDIIDSLKKENVLENSADTPLKTLAKYLFYKMNYDSRFLRIKKKFD